MKAIVVVAWHNAEQVNKFCCAWKVAEGDAIVHFEHDKDQSGCAITKNRGIAAALKKGADVIAVLDDDCLPAAELKEREKPLSKFCQLHLAALEPQEVEMFEQVTTPASRGTPYYSRTVTMPVAASMGFWENIGDYDAPAQLIRGATTPMTFRQQPIYGKYFAFSGMNFAFRADWGYCARLVENAGRFDDIWMGLLWQKVAYQRRHCFAVNGPTVWHSRQSNVFNNLRDEAPYLERNERLWQQVYATPDGYSYDDMRRSFQL